jgi:branched-chain amino acid transport system ATP-binding protein
MDVVRELADRIIVLHNGSLVADGEPAEVIASPIVQEAYLGVSSNSVRPEPVEGVFDPAQDRLRQAQPERNGG